MDILRILFYAFLVYLGYRLLFGLILPVWRTTRQVRRGIREMQDHLRRQSEAYGTQPQAGPQAIPTRDTRRSDDYIDFEEVK